MNLNAAIIDQRLTGVMADIGPQVVLDLGIRSDETRLRSLAFVYLCVKELLDLDRDDCLDSLTEGGGDFGVDAIHLTEVIDGEFVVTLFQGKYKAKLEGDAHFPATGVDALINAIRYLFEPGAQLGGVNQRMRARVEEVRSLIVDGCLPRVRAVCCNNGARWNTEAEAAILRADFKGQVTWEHLNHDALIGLIQRPAKVDATLRLEGRAFEEALGFSRTFIGRIPVAELAALMDQHGDRLLERNIRRYLGLHGNRVNEGIRESLLSDEPGDFYLLNNGLTLVCDDFSFNGLQQSNFQVKVKNLQIVNGGQTCMTILKTAKALEQQGRALPPEATVLVRLYKLPADREDLAGRITQATNSQNPVDLRDLRANDEVQRQLELGMASLGFTYRRKRADTAAAPQELTLSTVAEAILSVWRRAPHRAKFYARDIFGKFYSEIFSPDLHAAQAIVAVLLFRIAENRRRRPQAADPFFVRYAACFLAMQMGRRLLRALGVDDVSKLTHRNFARARALVEADGEQWFTEAIEDVEQALVRVYGEREISLPQLAATFRRGDLIEHLDVIVKGQP